MKCTDNNRRRRSRARRRQKRIIRRMTFLLLSLCMIAAVLCLKNNKKDQHLAADYEAEHYNTSTYREKLYAADLCVASGNVKMDNPPDTSVLKSAALFDVDGKAADYTYNIHEKMYPASTTKIMTALVAIKKGNLSDVVTVGKDADASTFAADEQTCGIKAGDEITLEALLNGLLLYSGNDTAVAIAEHVGGSVDEFAKMMNEQAQELMATNTHFVNPSGLHNDDHYTTAYDLYLIFNECIKHKEFKEIIQKDSYTAKIKGSDGTTREMKWEPTNYYATGEAASPKNAKVIGGKTGTTLKAGNCLILLDESKDHKPFISVVMGAQSKELLYQNMTTLIQEIPGDKKDSDSNNQET